MKKNIVFRVLALLLLITCTLICFFNLNNKAKQVIATSGKTVIIDAGHGGMDGGAVAQDNTTEKDLNLQITLKLSTLLKKQGYNVVLTRSDDFEGSNWESFNKIQDMNNRIDIINTVGDGIVISIHQNMFEDASCKGAQIFYSSKDERSTILAEDIRKSIVTNLQPDNNRTTKDGTDLSLILESQSLPSVIIECGFLSNKEELELLKTEDYQNKLAQAICEGIINFSKR